jgi:ribonuclease III
MPSSSSAATKNNMETKQAERLAAVRQFAEDNDIPVRNIELLNTALTHTSYANEHKNETIHDNERLEFLGDAVLDLVVGEYLFLRFPQWPEGELTRAKASAVCKPACAECAAKFHIGDFMRLGRGEEAGGGRTRISILGNAFEAVIGAIYLDNNYEVASRFILSHLKKFLDLIDRGEYDHDYKSDFQEMVQKHGEVEIRYEMIRDEGPDHDKTIWMELSVNGKKLGCGVGKNKKEAAQRAAKEAIGALRRGETFPEK